MITITDMFCGAGGSSTGAVAAGAKVKLAMNHWQRAIETHSVNHPNTLHALTDLHAASPRTYPKTHGLIASPECTAHTLARGHRRKNIGAGLWGDEPDLTWEAEERSRCTMWTPLDWAEYHDYQFIILENVVDVHLWRPYYDWLGAWRSLGYEFETVYLNSMFAHPIPQSRDRMYFVAWKKGIRKPDLAIRPQAYCDFCQKDVASVQSWKKQHYGKYRQQYVYRCPHCAREITPAYYPASTAIDWSLPVTRISNRKKPLCAKTIQRIADGLAKFEQAPFILDHLGEYRPREITRPFSTICALGNHHSLITPPGQHWIMSYYNNGTFAPISEPIPTVTTLDRHALISNDTSALDIATCGFRMLSAPEIQAAMAFPANYVVTGTHREKIKQLGNAVTPPVMQLLVERVLAVL